MENHFYNDFIRLVARVELDQVWPMFQAAISSVCTQIYWELPLMMQQIDQMLRSRDMQEPIPLVCINLTPRIYQTIINTFTEYKIMTLFYKEQAQRLLELFACIVRLIEAGQVDPNILIHEASILSGINCNFDHIKAAIERFEQFSEMAVEMFDGRRIETVTYVLNNPVHVRNLRLM